MGNIDVARFKHLYETDDSYKDIRESDKMKEIHLMCLSGSHAYGTARPDSDVDIRAVVGVDRSVALGVTSDWRAVHFVETDTEIFSILNFLHLISRGNPSILCLLGNNLEDYLYLSKQGKMLVEDYSGLFTAKSVYDSFVGYANSRLKVLELAELGKLNEYGDVVGSVTLDSKKVEILNNATSLFGSKYETATDVFANYEIREDKVYLSDFRAKDISMVDFFNIARDLKTISSNFGQKGKRNTKKTDFKLNKHCMHLVRGLLMGIELLETGKIVTYRKNDLELLHSILQGEFMGASGMMRPEFYSLVDDLKKKADYAYKNSVLPSEVNMDKMTEYAYMFTFGKN